MGLGLKHPSVLKSLIDNFDASLEPIGSVAPKVGSGDDLKSVKTEQGKSSTLLCSAQAYPTPVFR
jgi:hypothetical protein